MTPLVLVHGFMGGSAQWNGYVDMLARQLDLITVDLPGFGANADLPPIFSIAGYADWLVRHLRGLGVARYHLLGHSMGGMIAQEAALRDSKRIERLVLYATGAVGVLPGRFETIEDSKRRAAEDGPVATARRIAATWFLDREAAHGFDVCASIAAQTQLVAINAGLNAMQSWSAEQNLNQIRQETLLLWGDHDRTYPWPQIQRLWEAIPHTSLAVVPGCAHALHAEKPDLFQRLLADFLLR
ncbi:MAG: alpha/beta hydrolase [Pseudomonadota bacterium]